TRTTRGSWPAATIPWGRGWRSSSPMPERPERPERIASIDVGTNSTRLLVAEPKPDGGGGFDIVDRRMRITRLGQGVDATSQLHPEAIGRTLNALRESRAAMDEHGVSRVRMAATSASRDASNRDDFFGPATEIVGAAPELLAGSEEGRLSFLGATAELDVN